MSSLDQHEQEQVDALKAWWKENGKWVTGAVVVGLLGFAGIKFWKDHQANQAAEAGGEGLAAPVWVKQEVAVGWSQVRSRLKGLKIEEGGVDVGAGVLGG